MTIHSQRPLNQQPEPHIVISPCGYFESTIFTTIAGKIRRVFNYRTQITPLIQDLNFARDPDRNQYHSTPILEELARKAPPGALKVLAIARVDLFIPILTHVFGEAQLGGKACIVSTHRLTDELPIINADKLYAARLVKEAIHELGHTFNLRHCRDATCIMHYCRSVNDVDRKSDELCRYCRVLVADEIARIK